MISTRRLSSLIGLTLTSHLFRGAVTSMILLDSSSKSHRMTGLREGTCVLLISRARHSNGTSSSWLKASEETAYQSHRSTVAGSGGKSRYVWTNARRSILNWALLACQAKSRLASERAQHCVLQSTFPMSLRSADEKAGSSYLGRRRSRS